MTRPDRFRLMVLGALCALAAPMVLRGGPINLVANGGFETGDFTGWTPVGSGLSVQCSNATYPAHSGTCDAVFTQVVTAISQEIPTTPGATYTLDLWLTGPPGAVFFVGWGGTVNDIFGPIGAYTDFTFTGLTASSTSTQLFLNDSGAGDSGATWQLDDVSVVQTATPEPSTAGLLLSGLAALGVAGRLARRRAPVRARR